MSAGQVEPSGGPGVATLTAAKALRRSPLDAQHRALGARMVPFGGWEMPLEYERGTLAEHMACRRHCVIFDVSHLGTVRLVGEGAYQALQRALTNDLAKIGPGRAQYTHLLDDDGSVVDDLIVWWVGEDRFDVMPNASNTQRALDALGGEDVTATRAVIAVQGPMARAIVARVLPPAAQVARFAVQLATWGGDEVVAAGTGYTGEDGIELAVPGSSAKDLWDALCSAGAVPAGLGARDTLRLEAGLPLHGHELGPGITPIDAGLAWVVAWDKPGGFRGLDALTAMYRSAGSHRPTRRLMGIVGEGRQPLRAGYAVLVGGKVVAELTSGNYSPVLGRGIAMAFLSPDLDEGTAVEIEARGKRLAGHVTKLPFVRH
ncbi:MAG: glycine cleavage system aminomethyltransferase GcvT [Acidimicrobiales bacterium]